MAKKTSIISISCRISETLFIGILSIIFADSALALFGESELKYLNTEDKFDSEYFLDLLSFSYPIEWHESWEKSGIGYLVNAGSLDCCKLVLYQNLKMDFGLSENFFFKYRLTQSDDKDLKEFHQFAEFEGRIIGPIHISLFGEPTFDKEDSDIGAAIAYKKSDVQVRLSFNYVDFEFNQRNTESDRYHRKPTTTGVDLMISPCRDIYLNLKGEADSRLKRNFPEEGYDYYYEKYTGEGISRFSFSRKNRFYLDFFWEKKMEGREFFVEEKMDEFERYSRKIYRIKTIYKRNLFKQNLLGVGHQYMTRDAITRTPNKNGSNRSFLYRREEFVPFFLTSFRPLRSLRIELDYFYGIIDIKDELNQSRDGNFREQKLNFILEFIFLERGRLLLNSTFDVDKITSHFWDGGNVQFMVNF